MISKPKFSAVVSVLVAAAMSLCAADATNSTITITSPANNATVNCAVPIAYTVSLQNGDYQDDSPWVTITYEPTGGQYTYSLPYTWYTQYFPSGTYTLQAFANLYPGAPPHYPPYEIQSPIVQVTVKNGFQVVTANGTDTYAKVDNPTSGEVIAHNLNFDFTTENQISWTRYDACVNYNVTVSFQQELDIPSDPPKATYGITSYTMPMALGKCATGVQNYTSPWHATWAAGDYTAETWSLGPESDQNTQLVTVAHGANAFSTQ